MLFFAKRLLNDEFLTVGGLDVQSPVTGFEYDGACHRCIDKELQRKGDRIWGRDEQLTFIYLFGILCRFQHCTGHITRVVGRGKENYYIQFVTVLYCKLPINGKQLRAFPLEAVPGTEPRPPIWECYT